MDYILDTINKIIQDNDEQHAILFYAAKYLTDKDLLIKINDNKDLYSNQVHNKVVTVNIRLPIEIEVFARDVSGPLASLRLHSSTRIEVVVHVCWSSSKYVIDSADPESFERIYECIVSRGRSEQPNTS